MELSENARITYEKRYLKKDSEGNPLETPADLLRRVASNIAAAEKNYGKSAREIKEIEDDYFEAMSQAYFLPNSPTLMNAGRDLQQLSACFVLPVEDSMEGIFTSLKHMALVQKTGGGTGFSFDRLRPAGDRVQTTNGVASGPISFLKIFDAATEAVKQGGCVDENTRIATRQGLIRIKDLGPGDAPEDSWHQFGSPLEVYSDEGIKEADEFYVHGGAAVKRITTECGYSLTLTPEHRLRVIDEEGNYVWKHAGEIEKGDWVALKKHTYPESTAYRWPKFEQEPHFNAREITLPEEPTAELGEFIGYFIGDGSFNFNRRGTGRVIFCVADDEPTVMERIVSLGKKLFALEPVLSKKAGDRSTNLYYNSTVLAHWLRHIGVEKRSSMDATVPEIAFRAGRAFALGFLRGLFSADGTISEEGYISLSSVSRELAEGTKELLLSLGVPTRTWVNEHRSASFGKNPLYRLSVITKEGYRVFDADIGFFSPFQNDRLGQVEKKSCEFNDLIPHPQKVMATIYDGPGRGCGPGRASLGANRELYRDIQHYLPEVAAPRNLSRSRLSDLARKHPEIAKSALSWFLENDQFYDRVGAVEEDQAYTLDLSVPDNNTYIAAGFISHNTRRGANMGTLRYNHPDIIHFISSKEREDEITNFNLSVTVSDEFMRKVTGEDPDPEYPLVNPRTGEPHPHPETGEVAMLNAREVFDLIVEKAWAKGDPGIIFIDQMNRFNPTPGIGSYETTNPCGEQPLLPYEACCLGSINLGRFAVDGEKAVDFEELRRVTRIAVRFLDNTIDSSHYVIDEIDKMHKGNRKIGLGVMGWHDLLVRLGIPYDSDAALEMAEQVMRLINEEARRCSAELAVERGAFPNYEGSLYDTGKAEDRVRNATRTTIAPTGTISILAAASSGIEPYFSIAFLRKNILGGVDLPEVNPLFLEMARREGFYSEELLQKIAQSGRIPAEEAAVPDEVKGLFKTALEIDPLWHIRHQAVFQKYTDNAVSKTINLGREATPEDVRSSYILAWESGCKGITIYRDGSREVQVLNVGIGEEESLRPSIRPATLVGHTTRINTPLGNLFVTVNTAEGRPFELFAQIGKAGSDVVAFTEAIARLISLALRCGVGVEEITAQLEGIGGYRSVGFGPNRIMSVPDAIGRALAQLTTAGPEANGCNHNPRELCPDCGTGALIMVEGCAKCEACGYSEC